MEFIFEMIIFFIVVGFEGFEGFGVRIVCLVILLVLFIGVCQLKLGLAFVTFFLANSVQVSLRFGWRLGQVNLHFV